MRLLFSVFILFSSFAFADDTLNVLSLNVYMLPKPVHFSMQQDRIAAIGEKLQNTAYDVIFFQEAFMPSFREAITEKLKTQYPHTYYLDRGGGFFKFFGSGVFVMSRTPLTILDSIYYDDCASFDCLASKGVLAFETTLSSGKKMQFATTHLQAGPENSAIRLKQIAQIKTLLSKHQVPSVPQFLVGDLNIDYLSPEYADALKIMEMKNAPMTGTVLTTCARTNECYTTPEKKMWIDHVWIDKNIPTHKFEVEVKDLSFNYDKKSCPCSDHHAIEARYF